MSLNWKYFLENWFQNCFFNKTGSKMEPVPINYLDLENSNLFVSISPISQIEIPFVLKVMKYLVFRVRGLACFIALSYERMSE